MKRCPFCDELIQDAAIKCRYCEKWLDNDIPQDASPNGDFLETTNRIIVSCIHCKGKLRLPDVRKAIRVTCPHCKNKFIVDHTTVKLQEKAKTPSPSDPKPSSKKKEAFIFASIVMILIIIGVFVSQRGKDKQAIRLQEQQPIRIEADTPKASPKPSLPNKQQKSPSVKKQRELEPKNPNVLPLGAVPFDYDVRGGKSKLTIDNGTQTDALVRVIRIKREKIRNFFIPAGEKFVAESIPPGNYTLRVAFGRDWNAEKKRFNFRRAFSESETFDITESKRNETTEEGYIVHTEATRMSITLHKVPHGNFKTHPISEEEFWQ